jgi:gliding motility-associated-like protein
MKHILFFFFLLLQVWQIKAQTSLEWVKQIGGIGDDHSNSIIVDAANNTYITGYFSGTVDFDPSINSFNLTAQGPADAFVCKIDASGDLIWVKKIGDSDYESGFSITIDKKGSVYIAGRFGGNVDFDPNLGTYYLNAGGWADAFILKLDSSGNFKWVKQFRGSFYTQANDIAVDHAGNTYIVGRFSGFVDLDPGPNTYQLVSTDDDAFVSKLDSLGNFVWGKQYGGFSEDYANSITIDKANDVYVVGVFDDIVTFDPTITNSTLVSNGLGDVFILKLNQLGNLKWVKQISGDGNEDAASVITDSTNNVYITGSFNSTTDFDPSTTSYNLATLQVGNSDIFICKLDSLGNFIWAKHLIGSSMSLADVSNGKADDFGRKILLDSHGYIYVMGTFQGTVDFDPSSSNYNLTSFNKVDFFITKLDSAGNLIWVAQVKGDEFDYGVSMFVDANGSIYTTGHFQSRADFDPQNTVSYLTSFGDFDCFVQKLNQCINNPISNIIVSWDSITSNEDKLRFTWLPVNGAITYEVSINNGLTFTTPSSGPNGLEHVINGLQPNTTVTLLVRTASSHNCHTIKGTAKGKTRFADVGIFIPNTFTPNKDGVNDRFTVYGNYIKEAKIIIFNQWGEKIFETIDLQGWDGTYKGVDQPIGVYVFVIDVLLQSGKRHLKKGSINLIR